MSLNRSLWVKLKTEQPHDTALFPKAWNQHCTVIPKPTFQLSCSSNDLSPASWECPIHRPLFLSTLVILCVPYLIKSQPWMCSAFFVSLQKGKESQKKRRDSYTVVTNSSYISGFPLKLYCFSWLPDCLILNGYCKPSSLFWNCCLPTCPATQQMTSLFT